MKTYKIIRFFRKKGKPSKFIKGGLILKEAQAHCRREDTHEYGKWFDGYTEESKNEKL